ncbi:bifunctional 4-hydroxy-2-oxoglutarate aldolase/2-dehydro-3-deoxy-phosphogluconate aldolase [Halovivax gelatinilyticus]|uniref:bifunctional 4-hydroxy-2-oxoglutarate aldolase/2-dehydro-3-deoxy-phosphogluconate aldolase n=1 Tax=Halovivax gelatinilyticus TaxID=2961597 RepID=UPI0020CA52DA|nr:bifunctional 4-hydroxy-2-oxoglutarate aldolase/2-dehydro-3-deoxy-phosphogluconate aldolase [Halovivax gelatinilyticus]
MIRSPSSPDPLDRIADDGVVAVLRGVDESTVLPVAEALVDGGVSGIEITADDPGAAAKIATLRAELAETDAVVGAGTVLDAESAAVVIDAGATFVVTPHAALDVVRACNRRDVASLCGVLTPTEAVSAIEAGADALKVFPAGSVGPAHLSALSGPFGDVSLIPTGGVTLQNVGDYVDAGAVAVGVGGDLVDREAIESGDFDSIERRAAKFVEEIEAARSE